MINKHLLTTTCVFQEADLKTILVGELWINSVSIYALFNKGVLLYNNSNFDHVLNALLKSENDKGHSFR